MKKGILLIGLILLFGLTPVWAGIDSVVAHDFTTGEQGSLEVKFTNTSDVALNFEFYATCTGDIEMEGTTIERGVMAGQQATVLLPLIGGGGGESTCTVNISDPLGSIVATKNVTVKSNSLTTCAPYRRDCLDNAIKECSDDGVRWVTLQECGSLICDYDGGSPACLTRSELNSKKLPQDVMSILIIVALFLLIGFALYRIFHKKGRKT